MSGMCLVLRPLAEEWRERFVAVDLSQMLQKASGDSILQVVTFGHLKIGCRMILGKIGE